MQSAYSKSVVMGIIAGMRSLSAPAFVSDHLSGSGVDKSTSPRLNLMHSPRVAQVLRIAAAGEIVADKLPIIPDRISPGPLVVRIVSGAVCGAAICDAEGKRADIGALVGSLSAISSAFAFYQIRRRIAEADIVPDALLGSAEDALVIAMGSHVLRTETD